MMNLEQVPERLLEYIRKETSNQEISYLKHPTPNEGGYVSHMFRFQLENAPPELSQPLMLRLKCDAFKEGLVQNVLVENGYPAAPVHFVCEEKTCLGDEFIVMDVLLGETMLDVIPLNEMPKTLAETHVKLHEVDPGIIVESLRKNGISSEWYDGTVWIDDGASEMECLNPMVEWVLDNEPKDRKTVICHGDYHARNVLIHEGEVSGVVDWSTVRMGEPERDVASTFLTGVIVASTVLRNNEFIRLMEHYLEEYQRLSPLDPGKLDYYQALKCAGYIEWLLGGKGTFGLEVNRELLMKYKDKFRELTGITLDLNFS